MAAPVHSIKHIKAEYHRYQLMTVAGAVVTLLAIVLTAATGYQLARLGKSRTAALTSARSQAGEIQQRESAALRERLGELERSLSAEKAAVQQLTSKIASLQKQLSGHNKALTGIPAPLPVSETSSLPAGAAPPALNPPDPAEAKP